MGRSKPLAGQYICHEIALKFVITTSNQLLKLEVFSEDISHTVLWYNCMRNEVPLRCRYIHCLWVLSFSLQSSKCVCMERGQMLCAYPKLTFCLHHAWDSCSAFTALWCGSIVKLTFYLHQTPSWFWLVWTN